jgi:D-3-phosphoglycerate dehydrogenase
MKILATDGFSEVGIKRLEDAGHEVIIKNIAHNQLSKFVNENSIEGILVKASTQLDSSTISEFERLKFIGNCDRHLKHISLDMAERKQIKILKADHAWTNSVAELTIAHLFSCVRHLKDANREMPLEGDQSFNKLKRSFSGGMELKEKTLGIIGFGKIGQEVAKKALALGMRVKFYDEKVPFTLLKLELFDAQSLEVKLTSSTFEEVLSTSDVVSVHTEESDSYLIGEKEFQKMKPTAGIINTAHGKCIDELALVKHLENNTLAFGALDVFEDQPKPPIQLLMNPKLSLSPNLGGATQETQDRISYELSTQILSL